MTRTHLCVLGWVLSCLAAADLPTAQSESRKFIAFGWDEPDTTVLRQHLGEMEQTPFDGRVFRAGYDRVGGRQGSFTWESWSTNAFTEADVSPGLTVFLTFGRIYTETPHWWSEKDGPVKLPPAFAEALRRAVAN